MFNLLVSYDNTAWETPGTMSVSTGRFKEYSGTESEGISLSNKDSMKLLEGSQTLLMYELISDELHVVRYGLMRNINVARSTVQFDFDPKGYFPTALIEEFGGQLGIADFEWSRTHWAIKNGEVPRELLSKMTHGPYKKFRYEVVLSFAGEERPYVEEVANFLKAHGITVFYDFHEEANLWGKELSEVLDTIYSEEGRYCVMFLSRNYADKMWTTHERRSAIEGAMIRRTEYILPVRFDDTELPGIRSTIGYVDAKRKTPVELGRLIMEKLGRKLPK